MEFNKYENFNQSLKSITNLRAILTQFTSSQAELDEAIEELYSNWTEQRLNELIQWIDGLLDYLDKHLDKQPVLQR